IGFETTQLALNMLQVDTIGLDHIDHKLLRSIIESFKGGPVGLDTIAATIGQESQTIEDVYEPYLLQIGFLQRTPRGIVVTEKAYHHFGLKIDEYNMNVGKIFVFLGIVFLLIGLLWSIIGKLPGDIVFKKGNTTIYFPIMTSIIVSIILSIIMIIISKFR